LDQADHNLELIVSDNSTNPADLEALSDFSRETGDPRLTYIRPAEPLAMSLHWDWMMKQALANSSFSHVIILTDRMLFKKGGLQKLQAVSRTYPDHVVTYAIDELFDETEPPTLIQNATTGKLFEIMNEDVIDAFLELLWVSPFPTMLNSCVPRTVVEKVKKHYDEIFSSVSPDFNFGFKIMDLEDSILYYDEALLVSYGYGHSNGRSVITGNRATDDTAKDFDKNIVRDDIYIDSLLPFPSVVIDALLNEYFYIVKNAKKRRFPPLNPNKYRSRVISNVLLLHNKELREDSLAILRTKFGKRYYEYLLRAKLPIKRYGLRIVEESLLKIFRKEGSRMITTFETVDEGLIYAMNTPTPRLRTLLNFYKRTSIFPTKVRELEDDVPPGADDQ
jgi:hypothetical protein